MANELRAKRKDPRWNQLRLAQERQELERTADVERGLGERYDESMLGKYGRFVDDLSTRAGDATMNYLMSSPQTMTKFGSVPSAAIAPGAATGAYMVPQVLDPIEAGAMGAKVAAPYVVPGLAALNMLRMMNRAGEAKNIPNALRKQLGAVGEVKKMGQGGSRKGTVSRTGRAPALKDRQRMEYPGIYGDPAEIAASANVAPENPLMQELWGVTRKDLSETALGRQGNLPGWVPPATPAKGKGALSARNVMVPSNERRIQSVLEAAMERADLREGMTGWYVMDPIYQRMEALMGPEKAKEAFLRQQSMISLASPGSPVDWEINRGSAANYLANQGRFDEFLERGGMAGGGRRSFPGEGALVNMLPHPYHSTSQAKPMANYLATGSLGGAAKVPAYAVAGRVPEVGFQTHYPVGDAHWARGVGLADVRRNKAYASSASLPEMSSLAPWYANIASRAGLEAVPAQALQWGAMAGQTGVKSPIGAPKLELITDAIERTASRMKVPPADVRDRFLMGDLPIGKVDPSLLAFMGAGAGSAALTLPMMLGGEE